MGKMRRTYKIFVGRYHLGDIGVRWEDNIKTDLEETGRGDRD
jgi:hypothetical protein